MSNTTDTVAAAPVRIAASHAVTKRLGHWTTGTRFEVRAHRGSTVLDLRSPQIPAGDIEVDVDLNHAALRLLVADDATLDDWDLRRYGRGKVTGSQRPAGPGGRRIVLTGQVRQGEVRVSRGGIAILAAMCSRAYLADVRRARREGGLPAVDDPARVA
jgi:hypothetical protein